MRRSKSYWLLVKYCFLDYLLYSLVTVLLYNFIGRVHISDYSFVWKDLLIIPLSPFAILLIEGVPYFLIVNFILAYILIWKFEKSFLSSFIISTLLAHSLQYVILMIIDFNEYSQTSMSHETLTFDKIYVMIPSVIFSVILIWLLKREK